MNWGILADAIIKSGINTFGEEMIYHPHLKAPVTIRAVFDQQYQDVDTAGANVGSVAPVMDFRLADLPCPPSVGDRVCIRGDMYRVVSFQPDGQGAARITLHKLA